MFHSTSSCWFAPLLALVAIPVLFPSVAIAAEPSGPRQAEMAGYLLVNREDVDKKYNAGFSMYVAAWPLLQTYPGQRFQTGLFGTWMFAQNDGPNSEKNYSDIEGGLGWWRDTRFATETPKFIMGGVALNFCEWANGPGAGKGRDWNNPMGKYGVAQLSPWVLWPPDGLNLKQGTSGELVGYGYLPLPLTSPKATTAGANIPTGNQSWTLFLNTGNFKGPVAFFTPCFWSRPTVDNPSLAGQFLDTRPSNPNKALQMETQYIPALISTDSKGNTWARIAPTRFPRNVNGDSVVVHRITAYTRAALWDEVKLWFDGGKPASGLINPDASSLHTFSSNGGSTWKIYLENTPGEKRKPVAWNSFANPIALDKYTYGYRWKAGAVTKTSDAEGTLVTLPEYYRLGKDPNKNDQWKAVSPKEVPPKTGLVEATFNRPNEAKEAYVTPAEATSCWKKPGPVAGPFDAKLGDGSVVTYCWYRFADQPALLNADMTDTEREELQKRVEKLHRNWKTDREYLPPPTTGKLADLDPALLVTPPNGFEIGYVPIAIRQATQSLDLSKLIKPEMLTGQYRREPVENGWHQGELTSMGTGEATSFRWTNKQGVSWGLKGDFANGTLATEKDCPYFNDELGKGFRIELLPAEKEKPTEIKGFHFLGEFYKRVSDK